MNSSIDRLCFVVLHLRHIICILSLFITSLLCNLSKVGLSKEIFPFFSSCLHFNSNPHISHRGVNFAMLTSCSLDISILYPFLSCLYKVSSAHASIGFLILHCVFHRLCLSGCFVLYSFLLSFSHDLHRVDDLPNRV